MLGQWIESSTTAVAIAALFAVALALIGRWLGLAPEVQVATDVVALSLPFGAVSLVAQSVLQGLERLKALALATFGGRIVGLAALLLLLWQGAGVEAAFVGRLIFHVFTLGILVVAILRLRSPSRATADWRLSPGYLASHAFAALPFAAQRVLGEASIRGSLLVLPLLLSMDAVGLFDAADRVRQTLATMTPIVMLAIMPVFSRTFRSSPAQGAILATWSMKFLLIAVLPLAIVVAITAPAIIHLLYDTGYSESIPILQIVIWAQVFLSADMILKQAMIATENEISMLWRSVLGLAVQILLTIVLVIYLGKYGVALAIVVASALLFVLDADFVRRRIVGLDYVRAASKPLLSALIAGALAVALSGHDEILVAIAAGVVYLIALFALRTFTPDELTLMKSIPGNLLKKPN
jgi:O-antigen/teichoic acid export membrane protein